MKAIPKDALIKALILTGFAIWICYLLLSGRIDLYISPKLTWLSKLAALLLGAMILATLIPARQGAGPGGGRLGHSCACGHDHAPPPGHSHPHNHSHNHSYNHTHPILNLTKILIFCLPLLLGFAVKPQILGSAALVNSIHTAGALPFYMEQFSHSNKSVPARQGPDWQALAHKIAGLAAGGKALGNSRPALSQPSVPPAVNPNAPSPSTAPALNPNAPTPSTAPALNPNAPTPSAAPALNPNAPTPSAAPALNPNAPSPAPRSGNDKPAKAPAAPSSSAVNETDLVQLALSDQPEQIYNQSYRLTGFVYRDPRLGKDQFVLTRFVITCCIVDAQPIGIIAESPDAADLKADTWLEAEGVLKKRSIPASDQIKPVSNFQAGESTVPYFVISKLKRISPPQDPYLSAPQ